MGREVVLFYEVESGTWSAHANKDGSPEYDTGPAVCRTPEAALYALAIELYRMLDEATT